MSVLTIKQLTYEIGSWKRLLNYMVDENILLKNRLSEILKDGVEKDLLNQIEIFQNNSIKGDLLIGLLRNDIAEIDELLSENKINEKQSSTELNRKFLRARNNILVADSQFSQLKTGFNSYLSEKL